MPPITIEKAMETAQDNTNNVGTSMEDEMKRFSVSCFSDTPASSLPQPAAAEEEEKKTKNRSSLPPMGLKKGKTTELGSSCEASSPRRSFLSSSPLPLPEGRGSVMSTADTAETHAENSPREGKRSMLRASISRFSGFFGESSSSPGKAPVHDARNLKDLNNASTFNIAIG